MLIIYSFIALWLGSCGLWSLVFLGLSELSIMPKSVIEVLACWQGRFGQHQDIEI